MKRKIISLLIAATTMFAAFPLYACAKKADNETTALTVAIGDFDGVFNPFFATSGVDSEIAGLTQIALLTSEENENDEVDLVAGLDKDCAALYYKQEITNTRGAANSYPSQTAYEEDYDNYYTTYTFVIKDNVKFSDGEVLDINDVLFNIYIYLDPAYVGSSTMYSTKIKGLRQYRTQTADKTEEQLQALFQTKAKERIARIIAFTKTNENVTTPTTEVQADINKVHTLFKAELGTDWTYAASNLSSMHDKYPQITDVWQVYLFNLGWISENKDDPTKIDFKSLDNFGKGSDGKLLTKEQVIDKVYDVFITDPLSSPSTIQDYKTNLASIVQNWGTSVTALQDFTLEESSKYFKENSASGELKFDHVEGIRTYKANSFTTASGETVSLGKQMDFLEIVIDGVDPKAEWNFSFAIAPMHHYTTSELAAEAESEEYKFGVVWNDINFMNDVVRAQYVPIGAGSYKATNRRNSGTVTLDQFKENNVIYYVRNEHFHLGKPKIKFFRYKVINQSQLYSAVQKGEVHIADPQANSTTLGNLEGKDKKNLSYFNPLNLGYGYIGINASRVKSLEIRKAIMHAMDTNLIFTQYYTGDTAFPITRPMSMVNWAYPRDAQKMYEFDNSEDREVIKGYIRDSGYYLENGVLTNGTDKLEFTFTIAGDSTDHPAYKTMANAAAILNGLGFKIEISTDSMALSKLPAGKLDVWTAAWSTTIDPDMYQVYHKNSKASSVNAWGYSAILSDPSTYSREVAIINRLSDLIDEGRSIVDREKRKAIYASALDEVMELAVELPTYQRINLYVYNHNVIDKNTIPKVTSYSSPLSRVWELSFK